MTKRTRFHKAPTASEVEDSSKAFGTKVQTLAHVLRESLAELGVEVVQVSRNGILLEVQAQGVEMKDDLIKMILPVLREAAKTEKLTPFPPSPSTEEIELRAGIAEAKAAMQKRGPTP